MEIAEKQSADTIKTADRLLEALMVYEKACLKNAEEKFSSEDIDQAKRLLNILGYTNREMDYIIESVTKLKPGELDLAVLLLPEHWIPRLGEALSLVMSKPENYQPKDVMLAGRALFNLIRVHYRCLLDAGVLTDSLGETMRELFNNEKKLYNWNLQGLKLIQRSVERKEEIMDFEDVSTGKANKKRKKKKEKAVGAPILTVI